MTALPGTIAAPDRGRLPVAQPLYSRDDVTAGIVHFGFGAFHRAHQAAYLDTLMNDGLALDWGIVGVNVLAHDERMHEVMTTQRCRYTQVLKHADGRLEARTIGSVVEHLHAPADPVAVLERLADPGIRIVSLTITEGGYETDPATGEFAPVSEGVLADLAAVGGGAPGTEVGADPIVPRSVFGFIVAGLRMRRSRGIPPFTVLSCDNVQGNGSIARAALLAFAKTVDPELAEWMAAEVAFPSTMVDRITPITTDGDRELVREVFGVDDAWPVMAEPFAQWVIEDDFPLGRPPLERAGAQFVDDVAPYETMKLRLLNASHQALAHPSSLLGHELVDEAMADPDVVALLRAWFGEALAVLPEVPGIDLAVYCDTLIERYSNPWVRDTVERLAMDAENRLSAFVLPVVRDRLALGLPVDVAALVLAAHFERAAGSDDERREGGGGRSGGARRADGGPAAGAEAVRATHFLGDLAADPRVGGLVAAYGAAIRAYGVRAVVRDVSSGRRLSRSE
ncbi:mannitol dehydrogenase family protein [Herbiconiux sp. A18JL235]|uniref:Mannitol-1-phosphate 5-dehydrogenase n=1 Tax=Herbiconiux sp. A18JL235 TaxID=3152363 RepID=A0AB39BF55_9MICO